MIIVILIDPTESFDLIPDLKREQIQLSKRNEFVVVDVEGNDNSHQGFLKEEEEEEEGEKREREKEEEIKEAIQDISPILIEGMYGCKVETAIVPPVTNSNKIQKPKRKCISNKSKKLRKKKKKKLLRSGGVEKITKKFGRLSISSQQEEEEEQQPKQSIIVNNFDSLTDSESVRNEIKRTNWNVPILSALHLQEQNRLGGRRGDNLPSPQLISNCLEEEGTGGSNLTSCNDATVGSYLLVNSDNSSNLLFISNAIHFSPAPSHIIDSTTTLNVPTRLSKEQLKSKKKND